MKLGRLLVICVIVAAIARASLGLATGLAADYYANGAFAGTPAFTTIDGQISTRGLSEAWVGDLPGTFSVRWQGYVAIDHPATYVFATRSDDGSRVRIDDTVVVDNGETHSAVTRHGSVALDAGAHRIQIEYQQLGGDYELAFLWGASADALAPVSASMLSATRVPLWKFTAAWWIDWLLLVAIIATVAWGVCRLVSSWSAVVALAARWPRAVALVFFVLLTVVETWPLARHPARLSRNDNNDTILVEWILAWEAHEAPRAPLHLFDANIFYPERDTLAYADSMIVQSAMAAPLIWLGASPVLACNLVLLAGFALTGWSLCLVMVRWTGDWAAGLLSGVLVAFNAFTMTSLPHLQSLHVEFLPPALLALDVLIREARAKDAVRVAGWFALQALTSIYLLVFSAFALAAGWLVHPGTWTRVRASRRWTLAAMAAVLAAAAMLPYLLPYWRIYHDQGFERTIDWQARLAASWQDYLTTPGRLHYALWAQRFFSNAGLFPGIVGFGLTLLSFRQRVAFRDPRARMCLALGVVGIVLSFGPSVPGYTVLYNLLPPLHAVRQVSRFGYLFLFAVAALAGFGFVELRRLVPGPAASLMTVLVISAAVIEPLAAPLELKRFDGVSPIYAQLAGEPNAIVAELPFYGGAASHAHAAYMLNSTAHWKPMLNGYSGVQPASFLAHVDALGGFPDARSIEDLQRAGVTHLFVHADGFPPSIFDECAKVKALHQLASLDGIALYKLEGAPRADR